MFASNDVAKGGSFYLQSKVLRAKQTLEEYHHATVQAARAERDDTDSKSNAQ
jgi:Pam16